MISRDFFNYAAGEIIGTMFLVNGAFVFVPDPPAPDYRTRHHLGVFEDTAPLFGVFGDSWQDGPRWSGSQASWDRPDPYARRAGEDYREWLAALPPRWTL